MEGIADGILMLVNVIATVLGLMFIIVLIAALKRNSSNTLIYILSTIGLIAVVIYFTYYFNR